MIHPDVYADPLDAEVSIECDCGRIILARLRELKDGTLVPCQCGELVSSDLDEFVTNLEDIELQLARDRPVEREQRRPAHVEGDAARGFGDGAGCHRPEHFRMPHVRGEIGE